MSCVFDLVCSLVEVMTRPLLLVKLSCQFAVQGICVVARAWLEMLRSFVSFHLAIFWKLVLWVTALFSLPLRAFTALSREQVLVTRLYRMRMELDNVLWERKELEEQLNIANNERQIVDKMLKELEDENDEALAKIEFLEEEVQDLKGEVQRLKEVKGKSYCDNAGEGHEVCKGDDVKNNNQVTSSYPSSVDDKITSQQDVNILKNDDILVRQREIAWSRSVFSAMLSLVVGIIVWKAEDPCMPLVVALFIVVSMSLMSVVRCFSTIIYNPASEVVALLSFNWFVLGTLTYPTLPLVSHAISPLASILLEHTFKWLIP